MALTIADKERFVNDGPFWDKHPDVFADVTRYSARDAKDNIIEAWERAEDGRMVDVTAREQTYQELERAQDAMNRFKED